MFAEIDFACFLLNIVKIVYHAINGQYVNDTAIRFIINGRQPHDTRVYMTPIGMSLRNLGINTIVHGTSTARHRRLESFADTMK